MKTTEEIKDFQILTKIISDMIDKGSIVEVTQLLTKINQQKRESNEH